MAGQDGIVPKTEITLERAVSGVGWHNWAIKGWKTMGGEPYLIGKAWGGKTLGENGWLYFDRETINKVLAIEGTGAFTLAEEGNRFVFLLGTMPESSPWLLPYLPSLVKLFTIEQTTTPTVPTVPQHQPLPIPAAPVIGPHWVVRCEC